MAFPSRSSQTLVSCSPQTTAKCGQVSAFPSRTEVSSIVDAFVAAVNNLTDSQVISAVSYDINSVCAALANIDTALTPYIPCLITNINNFNTLSTSAQAEVKDMLGFYIDLPADFFSWNFTALLDLASGCDSFESQVASSLRSQLTATSSLATTLTSLLSTFDLDAFDAAIAGETPDQLQSSFGCAVPPPLVCTKELAYFSATCELLSENALNLATLGAIDVNTGAGTPYFNSFQAYSDGSGGTYPCTEVFGDTCFGAFLSADPPVPDLYLQANCSTLDSFLALLPPPQPTPTPTAPAPQPTTAASAPPSNTPTQESPTQGTPPQESPTHDSDSAGDTSGVSPTTGLSVGTIVGIVLGVILSVAIVAAAAGYFIHLKRVKTSHEYQVQLE